MRNFTKAKRIVIKIGTNVLTKNKKIDTSYIKTIAKQIAELKKQNKQCIIVTSGAIGFGAMQVKTNAHSDDIKVRQALAAVGQRILMNEYAKACAKHKIEVAQVLVTYDVLSERKTYLNLRNSMETLLKMGVVPVLNENDVVSIHEIGTRFGDNDRLSAMIASKLDADLLILLSDVEGLYTGNPKTSKTAKIVKLVAKVTPAIEKYAGKAGSTYASGGMKSKLQAAKIAQDAGCAMVIASGKEKNPITRIVAGEDVGTLFLAKGKVSSRARWILNAKPKGTIVVNECAVDVLKEGKASLLPVGIEKIEGTFKKGDVVNINDFARAVPDFSSDQIDDVKGLHSKEAKKILKRSEVVKKENIILL